MLDEILSPLLTTTWGRKTGLGILILMSILCVVTLFEAALTWRSDIRLAHSAAKPTSQSAGSGEELASLITAIPQWHLFGVGPDQSELPITSLQLKLLGTIKSTPAKYSRAIISELGQPGKIYQMGDTLPSSGVKVYSIEDDGVVLENSGRLEKLPLQRNPLEFQGKPKSMLGD